MISIIVATDKQRVIGEGNKIPWRIRSDLARLKSMTFGHTVILGRKTYESMAGYYAESGRDMPAGCYIVVTRNTNYKPERPKLKIAHSIAAAIKTAHRIGDDPIYIIGGGEIFNQSLPYTDRIYLTEVQTIVNGDVLFPLLNNEWHETTREHHQKSERDQYDFDFVTYDKS